MTFISLINESDLFSVENFRSGMVGMPGMIQVITYEIAIGHYIKNLKHIQIRSPPSLL